MRISKSLHPDVDGRSAAVLVQAQSGKRVVSFRASGHGRLLALGDDSGSQKHFRPGTSGYGSWGEEPFEGFEGCKKTVRELDSV